MVNRVQVAHTLMKRLGWSRNRAMAEVKAVFFPKEKITQKKAMEFLQNYIDPARIARRRRVSKQSCLSRNMVYVPPHCRVLRYTDVPRRRKKKRARPAAVARVPFTVRRRGKKQRAV